MITFKLEQKYSWKERHYVNALLKSVKTKLILSWLRIFVIA